MTTYASYLQTVLLEYMVIVIDDYVIVIITVSESNLW
jgi:hypothetical protein